MLEAAGRELTALRVTTFEVVRFLQALDDAENEIKEKDSVLPRSAGKSALNRRACQMLKYVEEEVESLKQHFKVTLLL
eukprot:765269-Hanusia_phi.AAC.5